MPKKHRDISDYVRDLLTSIDEIEQFTAGLTYDEFSQDKKTINAVVRSLEVLGEAAKHIPSQIRNKHDGIPWSKMSGLRDVLIHDYMGVDVRTVWNVAVKRIKEIRPPIAALLADLEE